MQNGMYHIEFHKLKQLQQTHTQTKVLPAISDVPWIASDFSDFAVVSLSCFFQILRSRDALNTDLLYIFSWNE